MGDCVFSRDSDCLRSMRGVYDSLLLPALDKRDEEGGSVNWKSVGKLVNFIQASNCITDDLRYSLKSRMKCKEWQYVLNTLTVYYTIALNGTDSVRDQMAEKRFLHTFEKRLAKSKHEIVRHAIVQLLVDWSFLFGETALGKGSADILRELALRYEFSVRPSATAATFYEQRRTNTIPSGLIKGLEFSNGPDQVMASKEIGCLDTKKVSVSCTASLGSGSLKLGSVKKFFGRSSSKSIKKHSESAILRELSSRERPDESKMNELLQSVPRDCKNLQDLLSDVRVLMNRGQLDDVQLKMTVAEQLRNKCATSNNALQETVAEKMKRVTSDSDSGIEKEEIERALLPKLIQTGEASNAVLTEFEQTHREYIRHIDRLAELTRRNAGPHTLTARMSTSSESNSTDSVDRSTEWVEFAPPMSPMVSQLQRAASSGVPVTVRPPPYRRPNSAAGNRIHMTRSPVASAVPVDSNPPPLPTQSPFADASALLQATRPKHTGCQPETPLTSRSMGETKHHIERPMHASQTHGRRPRSAFTVQASSRSFSGATDKSRASNSAMRPPLCPAMKVRFTQEHLEDVLDRIGHLD